MCVWEFADNLDRLRIIFQPYLSPYLHQLAVAGHAALSSEASTLLWILNHVDMTHLIHSGPVI